MTENEALSALRKYELYPQDYAAEWSGKLSIRLKRYQSLRSQKTKAEAWALVDEAVRRLQMAEKRNLISPASSGFGA